MKQINQQYGTTKDAEPQRNRLQHTKDRPAVSAMRDGTLGKGR